MPAAIEVEDLSKRFRLYQEKYTSLKERLLHAGRVPYHDLWALKHIDLEIPEGETVGILGRNGSGKSTLLKCVAGILQPTSGQVRLRGQVAAMLELGAGFQPELSGRDNIYLNASLLGMSRRDVERSFDKIVAFAELEEFIDTQVRFYSSGMYIRLGFAVAVNVDPDILLVDEVLAVGDERFQQKCMKRIHEFQLEGRTIVVVSHAPDVMRQFCDRVVVVNDGDLVTVAEPGEAIRTFRQLLVDMDDPAKAALEANGAADGVGGGQQPAAQMTAQPVKLLGARFETGSGRPNLRAGEEAAVLVDFEVNERVDSLVLGCSVWAVNGTLVVDFDGEPRPIVPGRYLARIRFDSVPLLDGTYSVNVRAQDLPGGRVFARQEPAVKFVVENTSTATGMVAMPGEVAIASLGEPAAGNGAPGAVGAPLRT